MNTGKISVRYARALFRLVLEKGKLKKVSGDMQMVFTAIREHIEFRNFLDIPIIPDSEKKKIIHSIFKNNVDPVTLSFLDLIVKNNRLSFLEGTARQFAGLYKKHEGITEAVITTVAPVDEEIRKKIQELIKRKTSDVIVLDEVQDPEIIGGFILKVEDKMIDASVSTRLASIRKELRK